MFAKKPAKLLIAHVGVKCVVSDGVDTPIYMIKMLQDGIATLTYIDSKGTTVEAGTMPISVLCEPTKIQLANDALIKRIYK